MSQPFNKLLVPLSLTSTDIELLLHAAFISRLLGPVECHFVHVRGRRSPGTYDESVAALERSVAGHSFASNVNRVCKVYEGALEDRLLEYAREQQNDLILMGHQKAHSRRRALGRRLAMHAPCSVWIVPEGSPVQLRRILVPVDFSPHAADALRTAAALARRTGVERLLALHVRFNDAAVTYEGYDEVEEGREQAAMDEFLAPLDLGGVEVESLFEEAAHVAHAVDRVAEQRRVDLVVMSTRGRSASAAVLLGSQTEQVLIETQRPLLAVKHFGARLNVLDALLDPRFAGEKVRFG